MLVATGSRTRVARKRIAGTASEAFAQDAYKPIMYPASRSAPSKGNGEPLLQRTRGYMPILHACQRLPFTETGAASFLTVDLPSNRLPASLSGTHTRGLYPRMAREGKKQLVRVLAGLSIDLTEDLLSDDPNQPALHLALVVKVKRVLGLR